jgi:hypothetical protein
MMQLLANPAKAAGFAKVVFELLKLTAWYRYFMANISAVCGSI